MKVILYRDGRQAVCAKLPGEDPEMELTDLLGGETEMVPLNQCLTLVTLRDGEELKLPVRYTVCCLGREPRPIAGDCAVVAVKPDGCLRDVKIEEVMIAESYIEAVAR